MTVPRSFRVAVPLVLVAVLVVVASLGRAAFARAFTVTGTPVSNLADLDQQMQSFMQANGIPAGQLAVGHDGTLTFSRAYTLPSEDTFPTTQPTTIFRVSSISKAFETAAMDILFANGSVRPSTRVYKYLGITTPLLSTQHPDRRAKYITVQELIDHTAGFHTDDGNAPEFNLRSLEETARLDRPPTRDEFARYLYGRQLESTPGRKSVYSNDDYFLLTLVIEKASKSQYLPWIDAQVLRPIGIRDDVMTATRESDRRSNEAICQDTNSGTTVLDPHSSAVLPDCYGGLLVYEMMGGATSISISAQSLIKFLARHDAYGLGPRSPGSSRFGSLVGSYAWMESLPDGTDFAFTFDDRCNTKGVQFDSTPLTSYLEKHL